MKIIKAATPEERLTFYCLRINGDIDKPAEIITLLKAAINWDKVIGLSRRHGIAPLLYRNLNSPSLLNYIPENIFQILKDTYFTNLYCNAIRWKEFDRILDMAREANINILPFKGIILSRTIYRDLGIRMFADIDALVKKEDLPGIKGLLLNRGYKVVEEREDICTFIKSLTKEVRSCLEFHTMFVPPRPYIIRIPHLWQRAQEEIIGERKIDCLSKEDTFLSLALHLRRHARTLNLKFIYDIALLVCLDKDSFDWKYIEDLAVKNHIKNCIYFCLYSSNELLGVSVAGEIMKRFTPGIVTKRLMHFCMNKKNFLRPAFWQGYALRILLFDRIVDFFMYFLRVPVLRRSSR